MLLEHITPVFYVARTKHIDRFGMQLWATVARLLPFRKTAALLVGGTIGPPTKVDFLGEISSTH